jgi:microcystin-dependent protein
MATVTASYNWVSGETVTPTKLNTAAAPTVVVADNEVTTAKILDGNVTLAKLVTAVQQALLPAGAVQAFAMNSAPAGWLAADGAAVSRSTYAALFAAISTTYGAGDGSTTFALPDLRGIFVRGSGSQTISGITYNKTFAAKEGDAFQGHHHEYKYSGGNRGVASAVNTVDLIDQVDPVAVLLDRVEAAITDGTNGTPRTASETRPANIALLYCIKF